MGWTSQDDLITQLTVNGKGDMVNTTKTLSSAGTAGAWTLLAGHAGYPPAATFTGSDLVYVPTDAEKAEWRKALLPVQKAMEGRIGKDLIDAVNKTVAGK